MGNLEQQIQLTVRELHDNSKITNALTRLKTLLKPGSQIVITNESVTANFGENTSFNLSKNPFEMQADLEAFIRLDQIRN